MKKYFCLILFLLTTITFSQKFEFDFVTEYVTTLPDNDRTTTTYSNSKNSNHLFLIYQNGNKRSGFLYDLEYKKIHEFKVTSSKENGKIMYAFKYKKSSKIKSSYFENSKNDKYEFTELENNSVFKTVLLKVTRDFNGQINTYLTEIKIQKSEANYFPNFRVAALHPWEKIKELDIFENGLVVESVQIRNGERVYPSKLVHSEEVELELIVPN
ncbi:hypothetical protein [Flavobacterium sp.]|uniref:hypothetical protein n=1 Tax=Flavobacterium sp. TaxID=239 RepID=UPI0026054AC5|nr:hypothetical protein [Flavobacterium sp.]MDD2987161.1 hypothetical protein [Flavobacterium sp.]